MILTVGVSSLKDFADCDENFKQTCNPRDKIVNQYGKRLVDVCRHCNIFILNGRSKSDHNG